MKKTIARACISLITLATLGTTSAWAQELTIPQKNAVRSAKQYLSFAGFSRSGLIQQLSSDAGDGYKVADATIAVDSLRPDAAVVVERGRQVHQERSSLRRQGRRRVPINSRLPGGITIQVAHRRASRVKKLSFWNKQR